MFIQSVSVLFNYYPLDWHNMGCGAIVNNNGTRVKTDNQYTQWAVIN